MPGNELEVLNHYKKKIENNLDKEDVLLRCLTKLDKVLVNISLLQDTGIGRTVSILKKHDNEVGTRSRDLVLKWKAIVAREESEEEKDEGVTEEEEVDQNGTNDNSGSDNNNSPSKAGYVPTRMLLVTSRATMRRGGRVLTIRSQRNTRGRRLARTRNTGTGTGKRTDTARRSLGK